MSSCVTNGRPSRTEISLCGLFYLLAGFLFLLSIEDANEREFWILPLFQGDPLASGGLVQGSCVYSFSLPWTPRRLLIDFGPYFFTFTCRRVSLSPDVFLFVSCTWPWPSGPHGFQQKDTRTHTHTQPKGKHTRKIDSPVKAAANPFLPPPSQFRGTRHSNFKPDGSVPDLANETETNANYETG